VNARAQRRIARSFVALALWSTGVLLADWLPWPLIAAVVAVAFAAATVHAVTVALYLRLLRRITTTLQISRAGERATALFIVAVIGLTYLQAAAADGPLRQLAVAAVYLLGLAAYYSRTDVWNALAARVARVHR
jgi:hypothetical protein